MSSVNAQAAANSATLSLRSGPLGQMVLARVVSMMLARAGCPVERLDEALALCDALSAHALDHSVSDCVELTVRTSEHTLTLRLGALTDGGASALLRDTSLPGVGSVLEQIADELLIEPADAKRRAESSTTSKAEELALTVHFTPGARERAHR